MFEPVIAPSGTLLGLLQRGRGDGTLHALTAPRAEALAALNHCVLSDPRHDWQVENRSLYAELGTRFDITPRRGHTILTARLADDEEARLLDLAPPAAVLSVEQIAYDQQSRPINLTHSTHHPTRYPLRLDQG